MYTYVGLSNIIKFSKGILYKACYFYRVDPFYSIYMNHAVQIIKLLRQHRTNYNYSFTNNNFIIIHCLRKRVVHVESVGISAESSKKWTAKKKNTLLCKSTIEIIKTTMQIRLDEISMTSLPCRLGHRRH